ncbi:MAG: hypothetical protein A2089_08830 [Elusimicrobia bacterium GWD2_63_28]|nr:MAG: hypothetical protein A2089_08830 [Elusimicrobia bacterium GWD2_63_28]
MERLHDLKMAGKKLESTAEVQLDKSVEILDNLLAHSRFELDEESKVRRERWTEILVSSMLSLVFGGAIALFSVWITNKSNMEKLDPYLDISLGEQDKMGLIPVSSDTLHLSLMNSGPTDVENIRVSLTSFHGSLTLDKIIQDYVQTVPNYSLKTLKKGDSVDIVFGNNDIFKWSSMFANEDSVYKKDSRYKGLILLVKLHTSYRRAVDKKIFHTTQVFIANRHNIVPIQAMSTRDDFLPGYLR